MEIVIGIGAVVGAVLLVALMVSSLVVTDFSAD
jgi:hypothetical protein